MPPFPSVFSTLYFAARISPMPTTAWHPTIAARSFGHEDDLLELRIMRPKTNAGHSAGQLQLAITAAPPDGTCIHVLVAGTKTVERDVDVKPGESTVLSFGGLPLGAITVTVKAFAGVCAALTSMSVATWVGDPVTTTLFSGVVGKIDVALHQNGRLLASVDFEDAGSFFSPKCMEC